MKLRSANAFWLLKNGLVHSYPSLQDDISCDVLVVGSGITGALMAFQLSSEGYRTVMIDRGNVGFGSTSATTAMLQYELDRPLYALMESIGKERASEIYLAGVESIRSIGALVARLGIDCGYHRKDSVFVARSGKDLEWLKKEFLARQGIGLDVHWLDSQELLADYSVEGLGAIRSTAGASLDAYRLTHELMRYAVNHYHLQIYDHTGLTSVLEEGDRLHAQTDGSHAISTSWIVYATGYETQSFIKEKIVDLLSTYVCISEPLDCIPDHIDDTIFWTTDSPYLYVRSTSDRRILVGGEDEAFASADLRDSKIDEKETVLIQRLREMFPGLHFVPDFSWAGTFGITPDSLPYIGPHDDFPRSFFVLGYGGNGIIFSAMAMRIISDAIAGRPNKFLDYMKFNR